MIQKLVFSLVMFLAPASALHAQQSSEPKKPEPSPTSRPALPDVAAQAKSAKLIREIYKAQFAETSRAGKIKLARTLISEARKTKSDPAGRFVLLKEAKDAAGSVGDFPLAMQAIDELDKSYAIDGNEYRVAVVTAALPKLSGPDAAASAEKAADLLDRFLGADEAASAARLFPAVQAAAGRGTDPVLKARVRNQQLSLAEAEQVRTAQARLKTAPNDPAANLTVGRHHCLTRGDWSKGLPMLAKGSDPKLKALAALELANPTTSQQQFDLAGGWYDWAATQTGAAQVAGRAHAREWYGQCEPQLSGLAKTVATKRLAEAPAPGKSVPGAVASSSKPRPSGDSTVKASAPDAPTEPDTHDWSELLDKADPSKATGIGQWQRDGTLLLYKNPDERGAGTLILPYFTDGSYEFQLRVTRHFPNGGAPEMAFSVGPTSAHLGMGGGVNQYIFLQTIDGKKAKESPAFYQRKKVLTPNREAVFDVRVSLNEANVEITVKLDGQQIIRWEGAQSSITAGGDKPHPTNFLIKGWKDVTFSSLKVHTLSGQLKEGRIKETAGAVADGDDNPKEVASKTAPTSGKAPAAAVATQPASGAALPVKATETTGWTDLLRSLDLTHTTATGKWTAEGAGISSGGDAQANTILLPLATEGSYEFQAKLVRAAGGADPGNIILPAGTGTFVVGIGPQSITLGNVSGKSIPTAVAVPAGKECSIAVKVTVQKRNAEIAVSLDGKQVNGWLGPASSLTSPLGAQADPQAFGLNTGKTKITFTSVRIHPIAGELRPARGSKAKLFDE